MIEFPQYQIESKLFESDETIVYRCIDKEKKTPVILKQLNQEFPSPKQLARFEKEFKLTKKLDIDGVSKVFRLEKIGHSLMMVFEDGGGSSLDKHLPSTGCSIELFLRLALKIIVILGHIHERHIIHKDLNPFNIIWDEENDRLAIIDFGMATELSSETVFFNDHRMLEGTAHYISPEQTGRINRVLDTRTDFYSLGCTFYQMLTGQTPFVTNDMMELLHAHIAKNPTPPAMLRKDIPRPLSRLTMKLLSKDAEERYQSCYGLQTDLQKCLDMWESNGAIDDFQLEEEKLSEQLHFPQKLYGRKEDLARLFASFERVCDGGTECVLVSGHAGVGKSSFLRELQHYAAKKKSFFISGKFEELKRNTPFHPLLQALRELIRRLLSFSSEELEHWSVLLQRELGSNLQLLVELLPEVGLIVGPQKPAKILPPTEAKNRFDFVIQRFVSIFCTEERPLVLFLDNLQWAALSSISLLTHLLSSPESNHLLFIGAFRDDEPAFDHHSQLDTLLNHSLFTTTSFELSPLNKSQVGLLLMEMFHLSAEEVEPFAQVCFDKTGGNPFFLRQFVEALYHQKRIKFFSQIGRWRWNMEDIRRSDQTENVLDLLTQKIKYLDPSTQELLKVASCVGLTFNLRDLSFVLDLTVQESIDLFQEALRSGLVLSLGESREKSDDLDELELEFHFSHNRFQQAVYSLLTEFEREQYHCQLGSLLLEELPEKEGDMVFEVANHFNRCNIGLLTDSQRIERTRIYLRAGQKARKTAAFEVSYAYYQMGLRLLREADWQNEASLAFDIHLGASEMAFLSTDFDAMLALSSVALKHTKEPLQQVKLYAVQIQAHKASNQLLKSVELTLHALSLLGIQFPEKPNLFHTIKDLTKIRWVLRRYNTEEIFHFRVMSEPRMIAATHLLINILDASYNAAPEYMAIFNLKLVELANTYGHCPGVSSAYVCYAIILCGILGEFSSGYAFGKLSWRLFERYPALPFKARLVMVLHSFVFHWRDSIRTSLEPLKNGYFLGVESGDVEYAVICSAMYCIHGFCAGVSLDEMKGELEQFTNKMTFLKQETMRNNNRIYWQALLDLQECKKCKEEGDQPAFLQGDVYNQEEMIPIHLEANNKTTLFHLHYVQLFLSCIYGEYEQAVAHAAKAQVLLEAVMGHILVPLFHFYDSLALLALYPQSTSAERKKARKKVRSNQKKMKKWADSSPTNCKHKYLLIEAERARIKGDRNRTAELYDEAIFWARKNEYIQEEALAYERAGNYYTSTKKHKIAAVYLRDAYHVYQQWGAHQKVRVLEKQHPFLLLQNKALTHWYDDSIGPGSTSKKAIHDLDLSSIMKAVQAISQNMKWEELLSVLIRIAIENAGAQRGLLFLLEGEVLRLEAKGTSESEDVGVLLGIPLQNCADCSHAIISFVQRTEEPVILGDGSQRSPFLDDPYVIGSKVRSVLCFPLLRNEQLIGVFYFENRLSGGVFTPAHMTALQILSSQSAISIENARLYTHLEEKVEERTAELKQSLDGRQELLAQTQEAHAQLKHQHQQLKQTQAQMIQSAKMASLGTLTAGIAHEINNPVNFVHGSVKNVERRVRELEERLYILAGEDAEEVKQALDPILDPIKENLSSMDIGASQIGKLANNLQLFSRHNETGLKKLNLIENISAALSLVRSSQYKHIKFEHQFECDEILEGWPSELNQAFMNIIINACEAITMRQKMKEEAQGTLTIRNEQKGKDWSAIYFEDDGCGMSKDILERVFEPFYTQKSVDEGPGLGLFIAFGIIEKHGGKISIVSTEGSGSTVTVLLPRIPPTIESH